MPPNKSLQLTAQLGGACWLPSAGYVYSGGGLATALNDSVFGRFEENKKKRLWLGYPSGSLSHGSWACGFGIGCHSQIILGTLNERLGWRWVSSISTAPIEQRSARFPRRSAVLTRRFSTGFARPSGIWAWSPGAPRKSAKRSRRSSARCVTAAGQRDPAARPAPILPGAELDRRSKWRSRS